MVDGNLKYDKGHYYPLYQLQVPSSSRVGGGSLERLDTIESMSRSFKFQTQLALEILSFYTINMARHKNQDE